MGGKHLVHTPLGNVRAIVQTPYEYLVVQGTIRNRKLEGFSDSILLIQMSTPLDLQYVDDVGRGPRPHRLRVRGRQSRKCHTIKQKQDVKCPTVYLLRALSFIGRKVVFGKFSLLLLLFR